MEMIEAIAREFYEDDVNKGHETTEEWDDLPEEKKENYLLDARMHLDDLVTQLSLSRH